MSDIRLSGSLPAQGVSGSRSAASAVIDGKRPQPEGAAVESGQTKQGRQAVAASAPPKAEPNAKDLKRLTEELQRRVGGVDSQLQFSVDQSSGQSVVKVMDRTTNEVIRQIPSKEMVEIGKALEKYQQGVLVNSKA